MPRHIIYGLLMFVVLVSCSSEETEDQGVYDILQSERGGDFRGSQMGDDMKSVLKEEGPQVVYSMPDELMYRVPLSAKDSTYYEISYNFNNGGLYVINLNILPQDTGLSHRLYQDFRSYYEDKYGAPDSSGQHLTWEFMSYLNKEVEISMTQTISEDGPQISITFFEELSGSN